MDRFLFYYFYILETNLLTKEETGNSCKFLALCTYTTYSVTTVFSESYCKFYKISPKI